MDKFQEFLTNNKNNDLFFHLILTDEKIHPIIAFSLILFIFDIKTGEYCLINYNHQDILKTDINNIEDFINNIHTGRRFVIDKKIFIQHIRINNLLDINLGLSLENEKIIDTTEFNTNAHRFIYSNYNKHGDLNKVIPFVKHKESVINLYNKVKKIIKYNIFKEDYYLKINDIIINTLADIERNGIFVNRDKFKQQFEDADVYSNNLVYSQYNIYTSTGRPSNRFNKVNYAALNKEDGSRDCFISRFGKDEGKLILLDYAAFHPRIVCGLIDFDIPIEIDIYKYLAQLFFNKEDINYLDIEDAKKLTFRQFYGGIEKKYLNIKYFNKLNEFIDNNWNNFYKNGYVETSIFKRRIYKKYINDVNPSKLFNYILQFTEAEIAISTLNTINSFLNNKLSKPILYTYDSILFDVNLKEMDLIKNNIIPIMTNNNKYPIKCYIGDSYNNMSKFEF